MNNHTGHKSPSKMIMHRLLCYVFILVMLLSACAVKKGNVYTKDGKVYGKGEGVFKEKWKDYYIRGLSYSEGGYWDDAIADFTEAIKQRDKDQRCARTYGVHFIDYFPNRELGVAYFNQGRYTAAIKALEASLASTPTARAKFYLNKARQQWLKDARLDSTPPVVTVIFPPPVYLSRDFSIRIKGAVSDNFFVSGLAFNDRESSLELAQQNISFDEEVPLHPGKNHITVQARDLMNNSSAPCTLLIKVDREGPLVFLEGTQESDSSGVISGALYDDSGIATITLNGQKISCEKTRFQRVSQHLPIAAFSQTRAVTCVAEDLIGNKTTASITIHTGKGSSAFAPAELVACAGTDKECLQFLPARDHRCTAQQYSAAEHYAAAAKRSYVNLTGLRDNQTVFLDSIFIEGTAFSPEGIKDITVNGESFWAGEQDESFAAFLKELVTNRKSSLSFSKLLKLQEGPNRIIITMINTAGDSISKTITIVRKVAAARQVGSRLTVAIYPFQEKQQADAPIADYVQAFLSNTFVNQKRFNMLERRELNRLLQEQKISQEEIFNQETAVKLGRLMASEAIIMGDIMATNGSFEIVARMVDTETSLILAEKDVYWEGKNRTGLKNILEELAAKFAMAFPLCEGTVINKKAQEVLINIGSDHVACAGIKFLAFDETAPVVDTETGKQLGMDTEILGILSVKEIHEKFSKGDIVKKLSPREIATNDKVIAK